MTTLEDSSKRRISKGELIFSFRSEDISTRSDSKTSLTQFTVIIFIVNVKIIFHTMSIFKKRVKIKHISLWAKFIVDIAEIFLDVKGDLVGDLKLQIFLDCLGKNSLGKGRRKDDVVLEGISVDFVNKVNVTVLCGLRVVTNNINQ